MPPIHHDKQRSVRRSLDDIFNGPDEFGMLEVQAKRSSGGAPLEVAKFEEINAFVDQHGHAPDSAGELSEKLLARRLNGYLTNQTLHAALKPYDRHNLLPDMPESTSKRPEADADVVEAQSVESVEKPGTDTAAENVASLDDIFASEAFSDIDLGDSELFEPVHVAFISDREAPDEVAQRRVCEDFYAFESTFKSLHEGLKSGDVQTARFQQASQVQPGDAFILEGVLCLIDEVGEYREDGEGRYDPRLRVIFENGTESNHLLRSLAKRLYTDETGRRIIRDADSVVDAFNNVTHRDKRAGQIYFVTTKSENPDLKGIPNLVKIGYTEQTVEERTKKAERDTAFLEAPVKILASMECYNLNPSKFETLIHGFLHAQRLKMTLIGKDGKAYHPKEWFSVPLDTAREVVKRIIDGSIVHYRIDNTTGRLVKKKA
ncbi:MULTISPECIES: GIY-YIG nuclease family protein [Aeromonas]|uniref:GIY-YIG nuclease family protein n=1 Tax=Aeromonas taiwanensis TaxID=633417 RepID=A0A5F0K228_9GAMM|nr:MULTISPECIES: GIY-YIG nuclease family protein [Aeromonas]MEA9432157.1 GIY-YIG nuclease family protein [Aeromonas caviae]TFF70106.1 GIY-YIG nuclease family protein [Aeromonas taiwanensis]TFF70830.1 GIY-YIG nuclease family protein [Aeromonas taiwanensis]TFF73101.1 GIY-YIG nuclease family protein [Aeromonas taiwanensis]